MIVLYGYIVVGGGGVESKLLSLTAKSRKNYTNEAKWA